MSYKTKAPQRGFELWSAFSNEDILTENVDSVLGAVTHLPIRFWKPHMFFTGARDPDLADLTNGHFPKKPVPRKSHPVFFIEKITPKSRIHCLPLHLKQAL